MIPKSSVRLAVSVVLVLVCIAGTLVTLRIIDRADRTHIIAFFDNSNGLFTGDEVRILGVPVGAIDTVEPQAHRVKVTLWVDGQYKIPADAKAAIVSPQLVTARAIQLTPIYTGGPTMADGASIPQNRTAVPLEWDDLRVQLAKLTDALQPTEPGGVSTLGAFVNTAAANLRGQGANIRQTVLKLSEALSILGDHSGDTFTTIKNLSVVVTALEDSSSLLAQLNRNFASVTGLLANDPEAVSRAVADLNAVVGEATQFVRDNRDTLGVATDKLASISTTVTDSLDEIKQALHVFPNVAANFQNLYQPAQGAVSGAIVLNNFADPLRFMCGSIAAAARMNSEHSSKLCMQYLAPIVKNRQYNFPPLGFNPFVGVMARPNEITYSEDRLRPDFVPSAPVSPFGESHPEITTTDASAGLPGLLLPGGTS